MAHAFKRISPLRIGIILLLICIVAKIILISLYSYTAFYQILDSDAAGDLLQAQLASSQGHLLFADNWYISTELHVIGVNVIPTILFYFGLSYRVIWALTSGIGAALIAGCVYFVMRMLRVERFESLLASLLILLPTGELSHWLYIHPAYQAFLVLFLLLIAFLTELIATDTRNWRICVLGVLVSFVCSICGPRLIIQGMLPVLLFLLYRVYRKHARDEVNRSLAKDALTQTWPVLLCAAGMFVGYLLYQFVLCNRYGHGNTGTAFAALEEISQNILRLPQALLLLYGLPYRVESIGKGVAFGVQLLFIFVSFACYGWLLVSRNRLDARKSTSVKMTTTLVLFTFVLVCLMHTQDGSGPTWRYWGLGTFPMLLVIPLALSNWSRRSLRYVLVMIISLLVFAYPGYQAARKVSAQINEPYDPPTYLRYLEDNGYTFGEATFWNANVNTVFSDGTIQIKPVLNDEELSFFAWLTHKDYRDQKAEFLLLTQEEYRLRQQNGWETPYPLAFLDEDYVIFAENATSLP